MTKKIEAQPKSFQVCDALSTFQANFDRDSIAIKTLNKGDAKVISNADFEKHLYWLNTKFLKIINEEKNKIE